MYIKNRERFENKPKHRSVELVEKDNYNVGNMFGLHLQDLFRIRIRIFKRNKSLCVTYCNSFTSNPSTSNPK